MTQTDDEIKTISQKTVSRDFSKRDLLSEEKRIEPADVQLTETREKLNEKVDRRDAMQSLVPLAGRAIGDFLRTVSVKIGERLEK